MLPLGLESFCGLCLYTRGIEDLVTTICPSNIGKENDCMYCSLSFFLSFDKQSTFIFVMLEGAVGELFYFVVVAVAAVSALVRKAHLDLLASLSSLAFS